MQGRQWRWAGCWRGDGQSSHSWSGHSSRLAAPADRMRAQLWERLLLCFIFYPLRNRNVSGMGQVPAAAHLPSHLAEGRRTRPPSAPPSASAAPRGLHPPAAPRAAAPCCRRRHLLPPRCQTLAAAVGPRSAAAAAAGAGRRCWRHVAGPRGGADTHPARQTSRLRQAGGGPWQGTAGAVSRIAPALPPSWTVARAGREYPLEGRHPALCKERVGGCHPPTQDLQVTVNVGPPPPVAPHTPARAPTTLQVRLQRAARSWHHPCSATAQAGGRAGRQAGRRAQQTQGRKEALAALQA